MLDQGYGTKQSIGIEIVKFHFAKSPNFIEKKVFHSKRF